MIDVARAPLLRQHGVEPGREARVAARELADVAVERRGEEHRLAVDWSRRDDAVDLRLEAHVEHPVGLVEDEHADRVDRDEAPLDQVVQPARRGDEDLGALGLLGLLAQRHPAVDGSDAKPARSRRSARSPRSPATRARGSGRARARRPRAKSGSSRSTIGIANASVFPEPVGLLASTSPPRSASGMTRLWTGNGRSIPCSVEHGVDGLGDAEAEEPPVSSWSEVSAGTATSRSTWKSTVMEVGSF